MTALTVRYLLALTAITLLAFTLRVACAAKFVGLHAPPIASANPDQLDYELFAYRLSIGQGYTFEDGTPTASRTPGTSIALLPAYLVTDRSFAAGRVWFALISAVTCALTAWAIRPWVSQRVALAAAAMLAVYPGHFYYAMHFLSEVPFAFWLAIGVGCALRAMTGRRAWWVVPAGVAWGMATLARPNVLIFLPVAAVAVCASVGPGWWRRVLLAGVQVAVMGLVLLPWVSRNAAVLGEATISTVGGQTMWGAHNPVTFHDPLYRGDWYATSKLTDAQHELSGDEVRRNHATMQYGVQQVRENMTLMPGLELAKLWRLVSPFTNTPNRGVYWAFALSWALAAPFCVIGIVSLWRRHRAVAVVLLVPLAGTVLTALIFYGSVRFRDSLTPVLMIFAAIGVAAVGRRVTTHSAT
ncbi:MAG: glycosyltransferase family 39 protein [Planctomycetes bacterium]|nr:glycosyltransferase family 39 protein [Planctomycetota bacterium]